MSKSTGLKHHAYEFKSNLGIECFPKDREKIESEILDAIIDIVESHKAYAYGGIHLRTFN